MYKLGFIKVAKAKELNSPKPRYKINNHTDEFNGIIMPTPSILTQINAPTPPLKANNGGADSPKSNIDSNSPSAFKKMLNNEVNQQQKIKNESSSKIKEAKKLEQKNNTEAQAANKAATKVATTNVGNQDKSVKSESNKKTDSSTEEANAADRADNTTLNQPNNMLNFVENIGLLNDQIQLQMAQATSKNNLTVDEQSQDGTDALQLAAIGDKKEDALDLQALGTTNLNDDGGIASQEDAALNKQISEQISDKESKSATGKKNNANDIAIPNNDNKIAAATLPPPNAIANIKTNDNSDKSKLGINDKNIKIDTKSEKALDNASAGADSRQVKDSTSKNQFDSHINNALNQQRQGTPTASSELENKLEQDFSSIKINALNAQNTQQLNAPLDPIKAGAITNYIPAPLGSKAWDQAMGQRMIWMVAGGEQSAQLTLNPPDLGPLQIVLKITDNQVDASFISSHLDVRETIESAMPKLRQMMDDAGIQLSGFSVDSQAAQSGNAFNQEQGQQKTRATSSSGQGNVDSLASSTESTPRVNVKKEIGLVDTFV